MSKETITINEITYTKTPNKTKDRKHFVYNQVTNARGRPPAFVLINDVMVSHKDYLAQKEKTPTGSYVDTGNRINGKVIYKQVTNARGRPKLFLRENGDYVRYQPNVKEVEIA